MTPKHTKTPPERPTKEDKRLFLRLNKDHEWRKLSPLSIKKIITERAGIAASAIMEMYQVRSGMAFECASDALRESILRVASSFQKENAKIEPASEWSSVLVPNVPIHIRSLEGNRIVNTLVTDEIVARECTTVAGAAPVQLRPMKIKLGQFTTNWIIHFKQKPTNLQFRLFDLSSPARLFTRQRPIEQCQRCWVFHSTRFCGKAPHCGKCKGTHETEKCDVEVPKCSNCGGPHESTDQNCMARPRRQNNAIVPRTPAELGVIRERGNRDFQVTLAERRKRNKDAEVEVVSTPEATMQES